MPTLTSSYFDLIDLYKSQNPDGTAADVIDMLTQMTPVMQDALTMECNNGTKHITTVRTGYPSVAWGKLYKGIAQSKSARAQVEDTTGFVEALSTIDKRILKLSNGKESQIRLSEAEAFLEAMKQEFESKFFYGDTTSTPEGFMGLAPRYNDFSAPNGNQIIDAGGNDDGENTSVWFVTWGDNQTQLIYPQGTQAGIQREDKGEQRVLDGDGNPYYVMEEMFSMHVGLSVKDWRYNVRVANIDVSDMQAGSVDLYKFMRKAYWKMQSRRVPGGRQVIYCNRDVMEALDGLATNGGGSDNYVRLKPMEIQGEEVLTYRGIPIRETDAILNTEDDIA